jgi:hypothetical protein
MYDRKSELNDSAVVMRIVTLLNIIMLSVFVPCVIILSVIVPFVMAPIKQVL